jgi:hypothetical protein
MCSRADGTAFIGGSGGGVPCPDMTCGNWTKGTAEGSAMVGHFDRSGPVTASWAQLVELEPLDHRMQYGEDPADRR